MNSVSAKVEKARVTLYPTASSRSIKVPTACRPGTDRMWTGQGGPVPRLAFLLSPREQISTPTSPKLGAAANVSAEWKTQPTLSQTGLLWQSLGSLPPPASPSLDIETTHSHTGEIPATLILSPAWSSLGSIILLMLGHLLGLPVALGSRGGRAWQDFLGAARGACSHEEAQKGA